MLNEDGTMVAAPVLGQRERRSVLSPEQAAREAVRDVPTQIAEAGGSYEQGKAIAEAMGLLLLRARDSERRAHETLTQAGFDGEAVDQIISRIRASFGNPG